MPDIASLGIAVDSSQADKGAVSLEKLFNAAKRAEAATKGVTTGARGAAQAAVALNQGTERAGQAASRAEGFFARLSATLSRLRGASTGAAQAIQQTQAAANDNVARMGGSMSGLAAQFQDIGVTAAMDMNPMIIALQQGTQIAGQLEAAMQGGGSAVDVLGQALKSLFSPLTFVTIALTGLAALGLQMVDWPAAGAAALRMMADALDMIAPYAAAAAAALGLMFAPALLSGAWALVAAITALGTSAVRAAASFTVAWLAALGPAGWFFLALGAATIAIYAFRDDLEDILGFDVVDAARRGANAIIGVFVGGFNAAKVIWEEFPDVMGEVGQLAMHKFMEQIRWGLRQLVVEINVALKQISESIGVALPDLGNPNKLFPSQKGPTLSPRGNAAVDAAVAEYQKAQGQNYVGMITDGIANGAGLAADKLRELAEWMGIVEEKGTKKRGKTEAERYQDIVDGADRQIASLLAERDALGMTEEAAAALRYEQDLLNQAQQKGIELTPQQAAYFKMLAGTMAGLEVGIQKAREAMDLAKDVTRGFIDDFRQGLEQGKGFWESFANSALNALDRITDKLLDDVLDALFQVNSVGSSSGGGIFGSLLGGIGKLFGFESGGYTGSGATNRAAGIVHGQEYVFSAPATRRIGVANLDRLHSMAKGYQAGGYVQPAPRVQAAANSNGAQRLHVTVGVSVDRNGNLQAYVKDVAQQEAGQAGAAMLENYRRYGVKEDIESFQQDPRRFG